MTQRLTTFILSGLAALAWAACSDEASGPEPPDGNDPLSPVVVSDPLGAAAAPAITSLAGATAGVTFVSLPPGSVPGAASVSIRNETTDGDPVTVPVVGGGFDPVAVPAAEGDTIELEFRDQGGTVLLRKAGAVPRRRPPVIVRTSPPDGRTDVALGIRPTVVFSEPVNPATLAAGVRLLQGENSVVGEVAALPTEPWVVEFSPAAGLEPATEYRLEIGREVLDADGDALPAGVTVEFSTTAPEPPDSPEPTGAERIAFVSNRRGADRIYLANSDGSGVVELTWGSSPAWSWDGRQLAFHGPGGGVFTINADGSARRLVASSGMNPSWSPDGSLVYSQERAEDPGAYDIWEMNPDGTGRRILVSADFRGFRDYPARWLFRPVRSPDGRSLAFMTPGNWATEPRLVWVVDLADGAVPQLLRRDEDGSIVQTEDPAWSPDGARIAVGTLRVFPPLGGYPPFAWAVASVARDDATSFAFHYEGSIEPWLSLGDPDWSPDGGRIAFTLVHDGVATPERGLPTRIHVVNVNTGESYQLIPDVASSEVYGDSQVAWSRVP